MNAGKTVLGGSRAHLAMIELAVHAQRVTARMNNAHRTQDELRSLMSELTGKPMPASFALFPPFTTDYGKNATIGEGVFGNLRCPYQQQRGSTIGENAGGAAVAMAIKDVLASTVADVLPAKLLRQTECL